MLFYNKMPLKGQHSRSDNNASNQRYQMFHLNHILLYFIRFCIDYASFMLRNQHDIPLVSPGLFFFVCLFI